MNSFEVKNMGVAQEKVSSLESVKEDVFYELGYIERTLRSLINKEEGYDFADTGDSMMTIDSVLSSNDNYKEALSMRKEASKKIIEGTEEEKKEGFKENPEWVEKVKSLF